MIQNHKIMHFPSSNIVLRPSKKAIDISCRCLIILLGVTVQPLDASEVFSGTASLAYRTDELNWNIAGTTAGTQPNILSELSWTDIRIMQLNVVLGWSLNQSVSVSASAGYGNINSGENRDSDYAANNRRLEWSRSNNAADKGYVSDFGAVISYNLSINEKFILSPSLGYSEHRQKLSMHRGNQTLSNQQYADLYSQDITVPPLGVFSGLDSRYVTHWYGPQLGTEFRYKLNTDHLIMLGFDYHQLRYRAVADWNLRQDLAHPVSFRHWARGSGWSWVFSWIALVGTHSAVEFGINGRMWRTKPGMDRVFLDSGESVDTRLNRVKWNSYSLFANWRF